MGNVITLACCSGSIGEKNVEEEEEDKLTFSEYIEAPHMKTPHIIEQLSILPRSLSETTTIPAR
jgi:hypothetical protein